MTLIKNKFSLNLICLIAGVCIFSSIFLWAGKKGSDNASESSNKLPAPTKVEQLSSAPISLSGRMKIQTQDDMKSRIAASNPGSYSFIKDAPILGYRISGSRFEDIPAEIRKHMGDVDKTKYTEEYLEANIGSIIALQMKDKTMPDFYIIGKDTFVKKYKIVSVKEFESKNAKLRGRLSNIEGMDGLINSGDYNIVGALKTVPVKMIKMSEIGYAIEDEVTIQSPWGEQTKPAGRNAYLVFNKGKNQYYMVNSEKTGNPINYTPQILPLKKTFRK